jgi:predicted nucleotidyltransferase
LNLSDPNLHYVRQVAEALGPLNSELVFVGGCATGLLITDTARPPVRATTDVDLVAEVATRADYYVLARKLKQAGFREDAGNVLCRWRLREVTVDVMPTNEKILGFTNRWYVEAVRQAQDYRISERVAIRLVSAPLLVATKIEAYYGRGNNDPGASHDIEDIVILVDGRQELVEEIEGTEQTLQEYLKDEVEELIAQQKFLDTLPWHFAQDDANQARVPLVIERLRKIARI